MEGTVPQKPSHTPKGKRIPLLTQEGTGTPNPLYLLIFLSFQLCEKKNKKDFKGDLKSERTGHLTRFAG